MKPKTTYLWAQVWPSGRLVTIWNKGSHERGSVALWRNRRDCEREVYGSEKPIKVKIVRVK